MDVADPVCMTCMQPAQLSRVLPEGMLGVLEVAEGVLEAYHAQQGGGEHGVGSMGGGDGVHAAPLSPDGIYVVCVDMFCCVYRCWLDTWFCVDSMYTYTQHVAIHYHTHTCQISHCINTLYTPCCQHLPPPLTQTLIHTPVIGDWLKHHPSLRWRPAITCFAHHGMCCMLTHLRVKRTERMWAAWGVL